MQSSSKIQEFFLRLKLFLFGVRFHEQKENIIGEPFRRAEFRLSDNSKILFEFFRLECNDIVLKRSRLTGDRFFSYVVRATFPDHLPAGIMAYHRKCYFFNGRINKFSKDEDRVIKLIADIYIDYVVVNLAPETKPVPL